MSRRDDQPQPSRRSARTGQPIHARRTSPNNSQPNNNVPPLHTPGTGERVVAARAISSSTSSPQLPRRSPTSSHASVSHVAEPDHLTLTDAISMGGYRRPSSTSETVDALVARATAISPSSSFNSADDGETGAPTPAHVSLLSSSLHERQLYQQSAAQQRDQQRALTSRLNKSPSLEFKERQASNASSSSSNGEDDSQSSMILITPFQSEPSTPRMVASAGTSATNAHNTSAASSQSSEHDIHIGVTPSSISPGSLFPTPSPSPLKSSPLATPAQHSPGSAIIPTSKPRAIPKANNNPYVQNSPPSDHRDHGIHAPLSSSAPVYNPNHIMQSPIEEESIVTEDGESEQVSERARRAAKSTRSSRSNNTSTNTSTDSASPKKPRSNKSRTNKTSKTDSSPSPSSSSPTSSPTHSKKQSHNMSTLNEVLNVRDLQFITNASESGYSGYDQMASHESLDYHTIHNELLRTELSSLTDFDYILDNVQRWFVTCLIGMLIGIVGFTVHFLIEFITDIKLGWVQSYLLSDWRISFGIMAGFNLGLVMIGSLVIIFIQPAACGSGIPEVKGFLNGTAISRAMNVKTFIVKFLASITGVASTLPIGPEGPMIHMGAMIGGGISQPRSKTLNIALPFFEKFHTDKDRRDFIAMGAACGIASAFGAPLGGVLFAIEEASSFWSQMLTWRTFFACMLATFITNFFLSGVEGKWGSYDFSSVIEFDVQRGDTGQLTSYAIWELIPFAIMGCISGLTGALFNALSEKMTLVRQSYINQHPGRRVLEMVLLSLFVSAVFFFSPFYFGCKPCPNSINPDMQVDCTPGDSDEPTRVIRYMCASTQYNDIATLMFTSESGAVRHLFSRGSSGEFSALTLLYFHVIYFMLAMYCAGSAVAGGLLVPLLVIGASYGRLVGHAMTSMGFTVDPGVYALIGAASFFSGVCRMTISLCIIMLEITNDLHYLPAIMLTVMMAKWTGDFFTPPIYEGLMELKFYPFLDPEPPIELDLMVSSDIMATQVKCCIETPNVSDIVELLKSCEHNGFPVVSTMPVHQPIISEPSNQRVSLGVPLPPANHSLIHSKCDRHSHIDIRETTKEQLNARPAVAKVAAATSAAHAASAATQSQANHNHHNHQPASINNCNTSTNKSSQLSQPARTRPLTAGVDPSLGHGSGRVLRGLILRKHLLILLQTRVWVQQRAHTNNPFTPLDFRQRMALIDMKQQAQLLAEIESNLTQSDLNSRLDLRPYMNRSPFSVHFDFHSVLCFRLLRSMGLRHLPVVNDANEVVGIITRKDVVHPIVKVKHDALLECKRDGIVEFPGADILSDSSPKNREGEEPLLPNDNSSHSITIVNNHSSRALSHQSRSQSQSSLARSVGSAFSFARPSLKAYSYLSPLDSSPEQPGTPVYGTSPGLLARPLLGHSPNSGGNAHRHSFNWSSRLTTRV